MGAVSSVNRQDQVAHMLVALRGHFGRCRSCRGAIKHGDYGELCRIAQMLIIGIAQRWDANIGMRLSARRDGGELKFLCPDLSKHGSAYRLAAEPVTVTNMQPGLF